MIDLEIPVKQLKVLCATHRKRATISAYQEENIFLKLFLNSDQFSCPES